MDIPPNVQAYQFRSRSSLSSTPDGPLRVPAQPEAGERFIRLSLVIPTFNEGANIGRLVRRLCACLEKPLGGAYELIVVDDDSPDRTWETAQHLVARYPKLSVKRRMQE